MADSNPEPTPEPVPEPTPTPKNTGEFDLKRGEFLKEFGIDLVLFNNQKWADQMLLFIRYGLPSGWTGMGEDVRKAAMERGMPMPKHSNAWGGVIRRALGAGLLVRTGVYKKMTWTKSNARESPVHMRS